RPVPAYAMHQNHVRSSTRLIGRQLEAIECGATGQAAQPIEDRLAARVHMEERDDARALALAHPLAAHPLRIVAARIVEVRARQHAYLRERTFGEARPEHE